VNRAFRVADSLVERLTDGHERHGQRWHLHLPREGEPAAQVRPLLVLLGLPTFGLALAISVLTTYGPVILIHFAHSPTTVGALIGGEGALALVVPLASGAISDRLPPSALGRRLPFVLLGAPFAGAALVLLPFSSSIGIAGAAVLIFFVGYYVYYRRTVRSTRPPAARALCARAGGTGNRPRRRPRLRLAGRRPPPRTVAAAFLPHRCGHARHHHDRIAARLSAANPLRQPDASLPSGAAATATLSSPSRISPVRPSPAGSPTATDFSASCVSRASSTARAS
jgi:hypothetical protein